MGDAPKVDGFAEGWAGLLASVRAAEEKLSVHPAFAEAGDREDLYRWFSTILQVAAQTNLWARDDRPRFVPITSPSLRWGGDNPDATYCHVAVSHRYTYRVRVRPGSAVYSSLTIYGGPRDGHYSTRIVGTVRIDELAVDADGWAELLLGPEVAAGEPGLRLDPDSEAGVTREYFVEPIGRVATEWVIEVIADAEPGTPDPTADLTANFARTKVWLDDQVGIVPVELEGNVIQPPYGVPEHTFGWAAGDAAYAMGAYELGPDERLVLRGRSPGCVFWNLCLWNPLLHGLNATEGQPTALHDREVVLDPDGGWTITVQPGPVNGPNQITTQGRSRGLLWFRWFLPDATPVPVEATVVR